jgi:hypothetical protein
MRANFLFPVMCIIAYVNGSSGAMAQTYSCPPPDMIGCVPTPPVIGDWRNNGGIKKGNSFASSCANVVGLPGGMQRLLCCYANCGVFIRDVRASNCWKVNEAQFSCAR